MTASLVVAVAALLLVVFASVAPRIRPVAQDQVKRDAIAANVAAQSAPSPSCNPGPGQGHLGVCAPTQALAFAQALGKAAGDPQDVRNLGPMGVDLSNNNGCSRSLRGLGAKFVYLKIGEGTYFRDRCAAVYVAQAKHDGIPFGGYEFVRPRPSVDPRAEAAAFVHNLSLAGALHAQLPPVADVEVNDRGLSPPAMHRWVCGFLTAVRDYARGAVTKLSIYTGNWFWAPQVAGDSCGDTLLWDSAYAPVPIVPPAWRTSRGWSHDISIWQNSDGRYGPTPHLGGVDTDVMLHPERYGLTRTGQPLPRTKPAPKPKPPKPATGATRAHLLLEHRHLVAQLRARHCARHRSRGDCGRLYRHNAHVHLLLGS